LTICWVSLVLMRDLWDYAFLCDSCAFC
jgi:hypothetical protein